MIRRAIITLACVCILLQNSIILHAGETSKVTGVSVTNQSEGTYVDSSLLSGTDSYDIALNHNTDLLAYIRENGTIAFTTQYRYGTIYTYSPNGLEGLVNIDDTLKSVDYFESGDIFINYTSSDNKEIIIRYNNGMLIEKSIYDPILDKETFISGNQAVLYSDFRKGTEIKVSEELLDEIFRLAEQEDWSTIDQLPDISVFVDDDGNHYVDTEIENTDSDNAIQTRAVIGFSSLSAMLSNLKSSFPTYTKQLYSTVNKTSNYLNTTVSVRLYRTRDTYVKEQANFRSFVISTALSVIASYLSVGTTSIVATILDYLGYAYSSYLILQEAATLYKSADYKYRAQRFVYVYDSTVYNDYVSTYTLTFNDGSFAGGYDPSGNFGWYDQGSSIDNYTDSYITTIGFSRYEVDLYTNGYCYSFHP